MKKKMFLWFAEACMQFMFAACGKDARGGDAAQGDGVAQDKNSSADQDSGVMQESGSGVPEEATMRLITYG